MKTFFAAAAFVALTATSQALPVLQLDIGGGTYDPVTQSIVASSEQFTVHALVNTKSKKYAGLGGYSLSAAVIPQGTRQTDPFGSFTISWEQGGSAYSQTFSGANMFYGTPPIDAMDIDSAEAYQAFTDWTPTNYAGDLSSHSVFETVYGQIDFDFEAGNQAANYNVQNNPGGITPSNSGKLLYQNFNVDISSLAAGYTVHFDLFRANGPDIIQFAPYSHDAQSQPGTYTNVPEGGSTLLLLGLAAAALGYFKRRR